MKRTTAIDGTTILYITQKGRLVADRLTRLFPHARVLRYKAGIVPGVWKTSKALIFIMASGIAVRSIAPLLEDKKRDPAVVVIDEAGRHAISLLSGHLGGANELAASIARFLRGTAVITTASDVNDMPSIDLWAADSGLVIENWDSLPRIATQLLDSGSLNVFPENGAAGPLPAAFLPVKNPAEADMVISNRILEQKPDDRRRLILRPVNLVLGIGCNSGTSRDEIESVVRKVLCDKGLSFSSVRTIATLDRKASEPGLVAFAESHGFDIRAFSAAELNGVQGVSPSPAALKATGAKAVAEPSAILGSRSGRLLVPKRKEGNVTVAVAEIAGDGGDTPGPVAPLPEQEAGSVTVPAVAMNIGEGQETGGQGRLSIVGTGPGRTEHITPYARDVLQESDVIVGYGPYLELIRDLLTGKEIVSTGMTREVERCRKAVEIARTGKKVAMVSGGDPGIYAMAGLIFELLRETGWGAERQHVRSDASEKESRDRGHVEVEVIPGISALNACASRLGAPLMHDFASVSLSDRLTPWDLIEKRLSAAAAADFVIVLYNPRSKGRRDHISRAREILLGYRSPETPVGIVRAAMRTDEKSS